MGGSSPFAPPRIIPQRCSGCGRCVAACPLKLISLESSGYRKQAVISDIHRCSSCGLCMEACPVGAFFSSGEKE